MPQGPNLNSGFHEWFYKVLLTSIHSIPIQSLWIIQIGELPSLYYDISKYELWKEINKDTYDQLIKLGSHIMIFARGVKIPGDGFNTSKLGLENTGMVKGNIGNGRKDMENLSISFLETNFSFTDTILRPWVIITSHKSLKQAPKATITITQYAKAGKTTPLIERGVWNFYNACPINITTQEYNYGGDSVIDRDIEFIYDNYSYKPGATSSIPDDIIKLSLTKEKFKYQKFNKPINGKTIESTNLFGLDVPLYNLNASETLDKSGAKKKGLLEKALDRAKDFGIDLLKGTGERVVTNVLGQAGDAVDRLIREGEAAVRGTVDSVAGSILDATGDAIDKLTGFDANEDVRPQNPKVNREGGINNTDDIIKRIREPLQEIAVRNSADTRSDKFPIEPDTPVFNGAERDGGSNFTTKTAQRGQLPPDGITGKRSFTGNATESTKSASKNNSDTPLFFTTEGRDSAKVSGNNATGQLDVPNTNTIPIQNRPVNKSDVVENLSLNDIKANENDTVTNIDSQFKNIGKDDTVTSINTQPKNINGDDTVSNINTQPKNIDMNDTVTTVNTQDKSINSDDTVTDIKTQPKNINTNDSADASQIQTQPVSIRTDDTFNGGNIPTQPVNIDTNDTTEDIRTQPVNINIDDTATGNVPVQKVDIKTNDTAISVNSQPVNIRTDDTVSSIQEQPVSIDRADNVSNGNIAFQEVRPSVNDTFISSNIPQQIKVIKRTIE